MSEQPQIVLNPASGSLLTVGPGMEFATLADALNAAVAGDTIAVEAGTYVNDFATVNVPVKIIAVGGLVNEVATEEPPNGKALLLVNTSCYIRGFSFSGGNDGSPDGNVAGIRYEAGNLQVEFCNFTDNEDGLLATPLVAGTGNIVIDHSDFSYNGTGDGFTHNLYVNEVASLTVTDSYFHNAIVGHEIKSRALKTVIEGNTIADGPTGTASYDIDIPNSGVAVIENNVIEKGPDASNTPAIHYGGETQFTPTQNSLTVTGNIIENDLPAAEGIAVWNDSAAQGLTVNATISNNKFYNYESSHLLMGDGTLTGNTMLTSDPGYSTVNPWLSAPLTAIGAGTQVLNLSNSGHTITGGASLVRISDTAGGNSITGGSGGIELTETGANETVTTQAGTANTISLTGATCQIVSNGSDTITANGLYDSVVVDGRAVVSGNAYEGFTLNGQDTLAMSGGGNLVVGAAAQVHATVTDNAAYATVTGGGCLAIDAVASVGGGAGIATITGAGTTVFAANGALAITAPTAGGNVTIGQGAVRLAGGAERIGFAASAAATVAGGGGADTYVFQSGGDDTVTLQGFRSGTDSLDFTGFAGQAVASGTVVNGNTQLTLTDGTEIDVVGVVLPGYGQGGGQGGGGQQDQQTPSPGPGTLTATGQSITGGASLLSVTDPVGSNTIAGGTGGLAALVTGEYDSISTAAGAHDTVSVAGYSTFRAAGNDQVSVTGLYTNVIATGTDVIDCTGAAASFVLDGTDSLSFADNGWLTVGGGAHAAVAARGTGEVSATVQAGGHLAFSQAMPQGGISWISVSGGASTLYASGGSYPGIQVTTNGQTGVAVQALSGNVSVLAQGADTIWAGIGTVDVNATGSAGVVVNAGAGNVTLRGGAGNDVFVAGTGKADLVLGNGNDTIDLGPGATTIGAGTGDDVFQFINGHGGGTDVIHGWSANDQLDFQGFGGNPIASDVSSGGSTVLTLTDNTVITLVGVAHY